MQAFCVSPSSVPISVTASSFVRRPRPTCQTPSPTHLTVTVARADLRASPYYMDQEGFSPDGADDDSLPDSVIYASLRRKAESLSFASAIAECIDLAGTVVTDPSRATGPMAPRPSLSPRDVVQGILAALQDDPLQGSRVAVLFSSTTNSFAKCTASTLVQWLSTSDLSFLLDISSFFVAPVPTFSDDRSQCVLACVVNTSANSKHSVSFSCTRNRLGHWLIESVFII
jgi:hypothetical protein